MHYLLQETYDEVLEDFGPMHVEEYLVHLRAATASLEGLENDVIELIQARRNGVFYAPVYNTSLEIH